jgi:hypothetical protein
MTIWKWENHGPVPALGTDSDTAGVHETRYAVDMRRVGVLFLMAYSLFGDTVLLQTGDVRTPPALNEARILLSSICPSRQIANDKYRPGMLACKSCPTWTGDSGLNGFTAIAIHFGHFTTADADQSLVATEGCEPHSQNWGGSVLICVT